MARNSTAGKSLRVLGFEPFDAGSHNAVRHAVSRHSQHVWHWITRPGRNWKWRMRLAAVEMIDEAMGEGVFEQHWDVIFITSLMSVTDLRAMLPEHMRTIPVILYMHENQAAYPSGFETPASRQRDVQFAMTNLTSILAADHVLWNSTWNKYSFIDGIEHLLTKGSDVKLRDVRTRIEAKSEVVWPPVEVPAERHANSERDTLRATTSILHNTGAPVKVAWPHRWEHDKGPDELLAIAERWSEELNLRWTILGEGYGVVPRKLIDFEKRIGPSGLNRLDHMGYIPDRTEYLQVISKCDWVLSTARHEFFGIAVVEAMLAGCLPWLPEQLSYPELLPVCARGLSPMKPPCDRIAVRDAIREHLQPAVAQHAVRLLGEAIAGMVAITP